MISLPAAGVFDMVFGNDIIQMFINAGLIVKIVLLILVLFSIVSWAIIFTKWRFFRNAGNETIYFLDLFWDSNDLSKIYSQSEDLIFSPVAQLFRSGYSELMRMRRIQNPSAIADGDQGLNGLSEYVERSLKKTTIHETARLEKALSFLATTGNTAPFIGLFGTVWGIMESFRGIGLKGSASLAVVAPGISEALIATAVGLAAAIPAVVAFNYFNNKASELRSEMDTFSADFLGMVVRQIIKKSKVTEQA
jgi:biopolymer transport protein TolQ